MGFIKVNGTVNFTVDKMPQTGPRANSSALKRRLAGRQDEDFIICPVAIPVSSEKNILRHWSTAAPDLGPLSIGIFSF